MFHRFLTLIAVFFSGIFLAFAADLPPQVDLDLRNLGFTATGGQNLYDFTTAYKDQYGLSDVQKTPTGDIIIELKTWNAIKDVLTRNTKIAQILYNLGYNGTTVDDRVKDFQTKNNISPADGKLNQTTLDAMEMAMYKKAGLKGTTLADLRAEYQKVTQGGTTAITSTGNNILDGNINIDASFMTSMSAIREYKPSKKIGSSGNGSNELNQFYSFFQGYFVRADSGGADGILGIFTNVAYAMKNFFVFAAVIFLIIGVLKLLFSPGDEESVKKWKRNIIWTSVGIVFMQMAYMVWNTLMKDVSVDPDKSGITTLIGGRLAYDIFVNILSPITKILLMLASFAFIAMAIYAFFIIVTGGGDEEKLKKGKNTIIYAIIGFLLIKLPPYLVAAIYGQPDCKDVNFSIIGIQVGNCNLVKKTEISASIEIIAKIFNYFHGFLTIICVLLVIYAGWLVFISGGDEEQLKKAKRIIIYLVIGLLILLLSHAIFRFFVLQG